LINLFHTACDEQEVEIVGQVLRSGSLVMGKHIDALAGELTAFLGNGGGTVPCGSGTDALVLALEALECQSWGVVVPAMTFSATYEAVLKAGAIPVVCDVSEETGAPTLDMVRDAIVTAVANGTPIAAVVVVHLYGWPAYELDKLVELCHLANILLIEDCAQAFGASFAGRMVGTFGDAAAFSFYPTKPLGGIGDGGAVYFPSISMAKTVAARRNHGRTDAGQEFAGYNSRMDETNAAILRYRLGRYDQDVATRRAISGRYHANGLKKRALKRMGKGVPYVYPIMVDPGEREATRFALATAGIESRTHYDPAVSDLPYVAVDCPGARYLARRVLSLPCHHRMTLEDVDRICDAVRGHSAEAEGATTGLA
jgi:dTDP-4-amino-4,6-dideoxygalactose transaminase